MQNMSGRKDDLAGAVADKKEQELGRKTGSTAGVEVYGKLDEVHFPMDAGARLKVKFRTGNIDLQERR